MVLPSILPCRYILALLLISWLSIVAKAQDQIRHIKVFSSAFPIKLDSLPVEVISVSSSMSDSLSFYQDEMGQLFLDESFPIDSVDVHFRRISPLLMEPVYHRDIRKYDPALPFQQPSKDVKATGVQKTELVSTPGLYKAGTISRGLTVGNRQDLYVNSTLNLQMQGRLSEDLMINAVITDQNIPYQPEGNTQQIRDFDNVFIEIYNDKFNLLAGDVVLKNPTDRGYFLKYYKNQLGLQLQLNQSFDNWTGKTKVSAAMAKGKFTSATIEPIEGVQGPYRLRGNQNERFVIVLANSEKVYIDGKLLQRGFDRDYVIDYNLAEITFNSNILITRFTRIRVDFEYIQQSYSRSNILASQSLTNDNMKVYVDFYQETDNEKRPLNVNFDQDDLAYLNEIGDDIDNVLLNGVDSVGWNQNQIRYERVDTLLNDIPYEFYRFSRDPQLAIFQVTFSDVGAGNGNYVLSSDIVNGRIYEWIAPIGGQLQGNYEPVFPVVTPNMKRMMVIGNRLGNQEGFYAVQELAVSQQDLNLFSSFDNEDNTGLGWMGGVGFTSGSPNFLPNYKFSTEVKYEFNHRNFRPIDRFRPIEFDRNWNYLNPYDSSSKEEHIVRADVNLSRDAYHFVKYDLVFRKRGNVLSGHQHNFDLGQTFGPLYYLGRHHLMQNDQVSTESNWIRSFSEAGLKFDKIKMGYFYNVDQNRVSENETDSLLRSAMYYHENGLFVRNGDSSRVQMNAQVSRRHDSRPFNGELREYTSADQISLGFSTANRSKHKINLGFLYREVENLQDTSGNRFGRISQGRATLLNPFFGGLIRSNLSYSTMNSRELRRSYIFTPVGTGEGTHTWRDDNADGVKDLEEFYEAINSDERNYIKLFTPTDDYLEAFQIFYLHTIDLSLPRKWIQRGALLKGLARLSANINLSVNQKTTSLSLGDRVNPFGKVSDDELVFSRSAYRYTLFYNRAGSGLGLSVSHLDRRNKQLNERGYESHRQNENTLGVRWSFSQNYQWRSEYINGRSANFSDFLNNRNFELNSQKITNGFSWQPVQSFRTQIGYGYQTIINGISEGEGEKSLHHDLSAGLTWTKVQKGSLDLKFNYTFIEFTGEPNSFLGYTMLQALQPGNNLRFNLNWQQRLGNGLQLTLQYFGRKSELAPMIHSGTAQLTAFF